jgi:hypothetical protein
MEQGDSVFSLNVKWMWVIAAGLALLSIWYLSWRIESQKNLIEMQQAQISSLQSINAVQDQQIKQHQVAAVERTKRLNETETKHKELMDELSETCDFNPDYQLPDAVYNRLCQAVPGSGGSVGGSQP